MAWDEVRLSRFQEKKGTSWWVVALALVVGAGLGFVAGRRSVPVPEPPEPEMTTTVVGKEGPTAPRDPMLAALHGSSPVQSCFARHGSRADEDKHDVIEFALLVNTDGSVESVSVRAHGHASLQSCLLDAAGRIRFPKQRTQRDLGLHTEMGSWFR